MQCLQIMEIQQNTKHKLLRCVQDKQSVNKLCRIGENIYFFKVCVSEMLNFKVYFYEYHYFVGC